MAEVTEEEKQQVQQAAPVVEKKSNAGLWISLFNLFLIIMLTAAGFYLSQQLREQQDSQQKQVNADQVEVKKQFNGFQDQITAMQSQVATFGADITGKDTHFTKTLADFSDLHNERLDTTRNELERAILQVQRQLGKTRGDWLIADAEYLLSVANQRLHLVGDIATTREALEAADQRLRESGDAAVFKVREQISREVASLKTAKNPDVVGMFSQLQILKDEVKELSIFLPYDGKKPTQSDTVHEHPTADDHETHGILDALSGYVTIRHLDRPVKQILSREQAEFIKTQMTAKLEVIKLGLVQQNDALYKAAIEDADSWLTENFSINDEGKFFQSELEKLKAIPLRGEFPDISQSLKMLRDITRLKIEKDKSMLKFEAPTVKPTSAE